MRNIFLIFIFILLSSLLYSTVRNVPGTYATIQAGINASINGDIVLVQPGTYVENINYNGKLITVGSLYLTTQDTTYISTTIIDGNSSGSVIIFENFENSSTVLCGFTITNGLAGYGGGIYCYAASSPSLENLIISNNTASLAGGGIACYASCSPSLENITISDNYASFGGGGIYCYASCSPILQNVIISGNSSDDDGGGIYCREYSSPSLQNVIISGNSSDDDGGGIYCYNYSSTSLQNVTITGNTASDDGGGIYCNLYCSTILINSILWNNSPQEILNYSSPITATYSDIEGGWTGAGNIDIDPLFVDPGNGDYHLQLTSPCIDAGDPTSPLDPDGTIVDMGAYYFNQFDGPIWHISMTGSDITGTGWEGNPFATIQHGINIAADTDTVLVHPGTYVENISFNGKLITVGSLFLTTTDTTYISSTIIDGNSSGSVVAFGNSENLTAVLCGFSIINGSYSNGGGIYCSSSSPSLMNLMISGNSAVFGGGILCTNSSASLMNMTISGNSADYGGGILCIDSSPDLMNITISDNTANLYGGGICCNESSPSLVNITISGNSANHGGGIYCESYSSPILQNVTISDNTASDTSGRGGGIYCLDYSNPDLQKVIISDNTANLYGGGIFCYNNSNPSLENVTFANNSAGTSGGGIYCSGSNPSLVNSIVWNDLPDGISVFSGSVTATYSNIESGEGVWPGTGNINEDPLFADPGNGDYNLTWVNFPIPDVTKSPCIDVGDPALPLDPDGTIVDMGAFYYPHPITAKFTADTVYGYYPLMVNFIDLSTEGGGVIDEWYWNFGDGNSSSLPNPANEYQLPGNYTVSLTVTDVHDSTDTETKMDYVIAIPPVYSGPVWHVSTTGSDLWGNGSTQYPFATIQPGINASSNTDTVLVQPGTYMDNINYNGKLITIGSLFLATQDTSYISSTIIDGNSNGNVVTFNNNENSTASLCGFTITNGLASGIWPEDCGGGIHCYSSSPSLQNLIISNNTASL